MYDMRFNKRGENQQPGYDMPENIIIKFLLPINKAPFGESRVMRDDISWAIWRLIIIIIRLCEHSSKRGSKVETRSCIMLRLAQIPSELLN